jgi:hypothetical protein
MAEEAALNPVTLKQQSRNSIIDRIIFSFVVIDSSTSDIGLYAGIIKSEHLKSVSAHLFDKTALDGKVIFPFFPCPISDDDLFIRVTDGKLMRVIGFIPYSRILSSIALIHKPIAVAFKNNMTAGAIESAATNPSVPLPHQFDLVL